MKLRCWKGCTAIITRACQFPENLGIIVEVVQHCHIGSAILGEYSWEVRSISRPARAEAGLTNTGFIPDAALTPITPRDGLFALTDKIIEEATA